MPNPYTLLSEIPERAKYFSVIDLKDASIQCLWQRKVNFYLARSGISDSRVYGLGTTIQPHLLYVNLELVSIYHLIFLYPK